MMLRTAQMAMKTTLEAPAVQPTSVEITYLLLGHEITAQATTGVARRQARTPCSPATR